LDVLAVDIGVVIDVRVRVIDDEDGSWDVGFRRRVDWLVVVVMGIVVFVDVKTRVVDDTVDNDSSVGTIM
jgi:hypothetical protein